MKKSLLAASSLLLVSVAAPSLAGCSSYEALDTTITGEVSVMLWSGDGTYVEDIGSKTLTPEQLTGQNQATVYAVAKAFKSVYPNVKVNVYAKSAGPNDGGVSWDQEMENFKNEHGTYPSLWASTNLVADVKKGIVADLTQFKDDPLYKTFNPSVMQLMNYYGMQAGLPQFLQPWGIYINKALAENNNIDVPDPDWNIDEYTDFITSADGETFWGDMDVPTSIIFTGTKTLAQQLSKKAAPSTGLFGGMFGGSGDFLDLNSAEVRALVPYISEWSEAAVWPQNDLGNVSVDILNANWWWSHKMFMENALLTNSGDPWMMGDGANPTPGHWGAIHSDDWDIYPRPSTPYQPNTVGVVLDPFAVYNACLVDGNQECSEAESTQLQLNYTFASFWTADTRAWQARADQMFKDGDVLKSAMNDSFPFVTGQAFKDQMGIWYRPAIHQRFADPVKMPGFQEVLRIWEKGQFWDISDKAYPWTATINGVAENNLHEWSNMWDPKVLTGQADATAPRRTDPDYTSTVLSKLSEFNTKINNRFNVSVKELQDALVEFYGFKESDFR